MNLWLKLNNARVKLLESNIPKSGHNKHLGFKYMELEDFLPIITRINNEVGLTAVFKTTGDAVDGLASLTIINSEKPEEREVFESPTAKANLNAKPSPVQELGAQHTYMRRYLYMEAYEIVEKDIVDNQLGDKTDDKKPTQTKQNTTGKSNVEGKHTCSDCGIEVKEAIIKFSNQKYKKTLCFDCQKKH